jgi:hypothetical protein
MASKIEILRNEEQKAWNEIHFYKEGFFYVAYEKSAWLFCRRIHSFRATRKFIKSIGKDMVSIGCPEQSLLKLTETTCRRNDKNGIVSFTLIKDEPLDESDFEEWKSSVQCFHVQGEKPVSCKSDTGIREHLLRECILKFPIENKTPMDCMLFVADLKKKLMNKT